MTAFKTTLITAFTVGAAAIAFSGSALAEHDDYGYGNGSGWGKGGRSIEVYIDAGHNRELERVIAKRLEQAGRNVRVVWSPRYADVTIRLNGRTSDIHRHGGGHRRYNDGYLSLDYNYKIKVKAGRRTVFNDRIEGQVTQPLRTGWYPGSYEKGELAKDLFGIFVDIISDNEDGYAYAGGDRYPREGGRHHDGRRDEWRLEDRMRFEAYQEIADYVVRVALPNRRGPGYRDNDRHERRW